MVGLTQVGDRGLASGVERGSGKDQDRGIDHQRKGQRNGAVPGGKFQGLPLVRKRVAIVAGLDDGGMQVQVMRHHGGPKDAKGKIQHVGIADDVGCRRKAPDHTAPIRRGQGDLHGETGGDDGEQGDNKGFKPAKALVLQPQYHKNIQRGDQNANLQRDAEQQVQPDGGADHLGDVGRDDRQFGGDPQGDCDKGRKGVAAGLGQIAAGGDGKPGTQRLQHDGHQVRHQCHRQQSIAEL